MAESPQVELDAPTSEAIDGRQIRAATFHAVRMEYVVATVAELGVDPATSTALVVGGGRGTLSRGLAGLGFRVLSLDPSPVATELATAASAVEGLGVEHRCAPAEALGVAAESYDLVYVADTFEITRDLEGVVQQAARALRPGGVLVYDTVNRTPLSRLVYLWVFQGLNSTRIMPPGRYSADRLRRPADLSDVLDRHGLQCLDTCDFKPTNPIDLGRAVLARRRGEITDDQVATRVRFVLSPRGRPLVTYLGHARKR